MAIDYYDLRALRLRSVLEIFYEAGKGRKGGRCGRV